jgi:hypothetical protein
VVSDKTIFKISANENTLWALAAMLDFKSAPKNFTFSSFFLKSHSRFESILAEIFSGWSYSRFLFLALIGNPTWLPGPIMCSDHPMIFPAKSQFN